MEKNLTSNGIHFTCQCKKDGVVETIPSFCLILIYIFDFENNISICLQM
jgi:hypothetical protein